MSMPKLSRFIGGVLLIVGTSIGGGMLALPVANAALGFWPSSLFLLICWGLMTLGALFILEVNLYLPPGKNMISMASATLGLPGIIIAWLSYLFLLYTLLSAYISGGADVLNGVLQKIHIHASDWQLILSFTLLFGFIVYGGIRRVDWVNRGLMFGKLAIYLILVVLFVPHIHMKHIQSGSFYSFSGSLMILITSFGYAIIVPNLRQYFNDDIRKLRKVILIGSLIPLACYMAWDAVIMGSLSTSGLITLMNSTHATSELALMLSNNVHNVAINSLFVTFSSICMLTAFLGVSLSLMSFLSDALTLQQRSWQGFILFLLTFLPAVILVLLYPGIYMHALNYAGFFCVILLLLLPALMSYFGRQNATRLYVVPGGKFSQLLLIISSIFLLIIAI